MLWYPCTSIEYIAYIQCGLLHLIYVGFYCVREGRDNVMYTQLRGRMSGRVHALAADNTYMYCIALGAGVWSLCILYTVLSLVHEQNRRSLCGVNLFGCLVRHRRCLARACSTNRIRARPVSCERLDWYMMWWHQLGGITCSLTIVRWMWSVRKWPRWIRQVDSLERVLIYEGTVFFFILLCILWIR